MEKNLMKVLQVFVCAVLVVQASGCGTLMYPERRGQRGGHIDVGIAVLDGIGLFFFLIPGIIAYAVDFSNGTIYLPATSKSSLDLKNIKQVKFNPKNTTLVALERIIKDQTGCTVKFNQSDMRITKLRSSHEIQEQFAQVTLGNQDKRLSFNY
ncbi:MAG: hypothetical protein HQL21_08065 [Candidatus Omnitrophica bacterium]|nr:hypothetical protein [Candidatus Omnitrophota bacterium]